MRWTIAAAMMPVSAPSCVLEPVDRDATDMALFLDETVSGVQRIVIESALTGDGRVSAVVFETREQAYQRFRVRWADAPDFVAAVRADSLPESFRIRLTSPAEDAAVRERYTAMPGVRLIIGRSCSPDAPVGGAL